MRPCLAKLGRFLRGWADSADYGGFRRYSADDLFELGVSAPSVYRLSNPASVLQKAEQDSPD